MQQEVKYSEAIGLKYPEQLVIAIARDVRGRCNPITLGWVMPTSNEPPMMAVAIGLQRYSLEVFSHAHEFVLAFPSESQLNEVILFGTKSGRDVDKLELAQSKTQPASRIKCLLLADAVANFECKLVSQLKTGDHMLLVGEVVCSHRNIKDLSRLYTLGEGLQMGGLPRKPPR